MEVDKDDKEEKMIRRNYKFTGVDDQEKRQVYRSGSMTVRECETLMEKKL